MSLDTILKIGKIYRESNALDEHRYVNKMSDDIKGFVRSKGEDGKPVDVIIYSVPVREDQDGAWHIYPNETQIVDMIREEFIDSLRYFNYKTSDKDSDKKYLFGDILYAQIPDKKSGVKEGGNYRLANDKKPSSFFRGREDVKNVSSSLVQTFSSSFEKNIEAIENLLSSHLAVGIVFDFNGKLWYQVEGIMEALNQKLIGEFVVERRIEGGKKVISLGKSLFKTIKSPSFDEGKGLFSDPVGLGGVMPGFNNSAGHKICTFSHLDDVVDLFYAINTAEKKFIKKINDIGILALPKSPHLNKSHLDNFFNKRGLAYEDTEENLLSNISDSLSDDLFAPVTENDLPNDVTFDIVFLKCPSTSTPSVDFIEISNLNRSFLRDIDYAIREKRKRVEMELAEERKNLQKPFKMAFGIANSFYNLLDNRTTGKKKYQSHLLKVLPQIYSDTYYRDPILLTAFIEQVEFNVRNSDKQVNYIPLKYYFLFLTYIQKEDFMKKITHSSSYNLGKCLGTMARPFAARWKSNPSPIKSFEKTYVGSLTRRISKLDDVTLLYNYLCEKFSYHPEVVYKDQREAIAEFAEIRKQFEGGYNREECAFGFFEAYFALATEAQPSENENKD